MREALFCLPTDKVDQRRDAPVSTAFTDFGVVFLANFNAEILIDLVQQIRRIHMLPLRGATRAQVNLLGCVTVEQEDAPGPQGGRKAGENRSHRVGRHELNEDSHDVVELLRRPVDIEDVLQLVVDADPHPGRQLPGLCETNLRIISRLNPIPLPRQEGRIAPLSIGNDQRLAPGDKARLQLDQSRGRLGAKR